MILQQIQQTFGSLGSPLFSPRFYLLHHNLDTLIATLHRRITQQRRNALIYRLITNNQALNTSKIL